MTVTDLHATTIPAGWYPDPVDSARLRWWAGDTWTEYTAPTEPVVIAQPTVVAPPAVIAQPAVIAETVGFMEPAAADFTRFSRDPLVTGQPASISTATIVAAGRKDPYRDRNVVSGIALVAAVIGLLAFVAGQLLELPDLILYLAGGTPFTIAGVAIVVAIRTGRGLLLAVIAAVLSAVNLGMVMTLNAMQAGEQVGAVLESSTPTFEQSLEASLVDSANTLGMPGVATAADCPDVPTPAKGEVIECIVTYDTGYSYRVDVTSEDGLGGMFFELDDTPIGSSEG